jgi:hypothetical protein
MGLIGQNAEVTSFACMFEPPSIDMRLVAQSAVFTLCSETSCSFDTFLQRHDMTAALTKYIIPARGRSISRPTGSPER